MTQRTRHNPTKPGTALWLIMKVCESGARMARGRFFRRGADGRGHFRRERRAYVSRAGGGDAVFVRAGPLVAGPRGRTAAAMDRMKICYLDAFSGISGDMLVGALADAGAGQDAIIDAIASLETGATVSFEKVKRCGIGATKYHVYV